MSQSLEYTSDDESLQGSSEYHSRQELESERKQIILVDCDEEFTFLNIQFPMPLEFPKLYIQLNELISTVDHVVAKLYDGIQSIAGDPQRALGYIIHHFNIDRVSKCLHTFPDYSYDQFTTRLILIPLNSTCYKTTTKSLENIYKMLLYKNS